MKGRETVGVGKVLLGWYPAVIALDSSGHRGCSKLVLSGLGGKPHLTLALGAFVGSLQGPAGMLVILPVIWVAVADVISLRFWKSSGNTGEYTHHFGMFLGQD